MPLKGLEGPEIKSELKEARFLEQMATDATHVLIGFGIMVIILVLTVAVVYYLTVLRK